MAHNMFASMQKIFFAAAKDNGIDIPEDELAQTEESLKRQCAQQVEAECKKARTSNSCF